MVCGGGQYHAFSIHVHEEGVISADFEGTQPKDAPGLRGHIDVCEVSMNICLGTSEFTGSAVYFGPAGQESNELRSSDDLVETGVRVAHVPGRAFINVCQHYHGVEPLVSVLITSDHCCHQAFSNEKNVE
jgi:hypothetical protein